MGISFGGELALNPLTLRDQLIAQNLPAEWFGLPNQFTCAEGTDPDAGTGWLLLSRDSLDTLDLDTLYPLVFTHQEKPGSVACTVPLKNLVIVDAVCVTPGLREDSNAAYLVRIADRRYLYQHIPIDTAYNVVSTPDPLTYYSATLNSGSPWTWQQMFTDVWNAVGKLGTAPTLPFTPEGTPEGFSFYGGYAMAALGQILDRLACGLKLDPTTDTFSVVRLGVADTTEASALDKRDGVRVWDDDALESTRARLPAAVKVAFVKSLTVADTTGGSPYYYVTQTDPTAGGPLPGTETSTAFVLFDDELATYDSGGSLTNAAALATRAAERAADWFRVARMEKLRRIYGKPLGDKGLLPGGRRFATRWGDRGRGMVTEVVWTAKDVRNEPPEGTVPPPPTWVGVQSWVPQTIPGTTGIGYSALVATYSGGSFSNTSTGCWFYNPNGYTATNEDYFFCQQIGVDSSGNAIYAAASPTTVWLQATSSTPQAVSIGGLGSLTAYPAELYHFPSQQGQGGLADATVIAWLVPVNWTGFSAGNAGQPIMPPTIKSFYQGTFIGTDGSGTPAYFMNNADLHPAPVPQYFSWSSSPALSNGSSVNLATVTITPPLFYRNLAGGNVNTIYEVKGSIQLTVNGSASGYTFVSAGVAFTSGPGATNYNIVTGKGFFPPLAQTMTITLPIYGVVDMAGGTSAVVLTLFATMSGPTGVSGFAVGGGNPNTLHSSNTGCISVIPIATLL